MLERQNIYIPKRSERLSELFFARDVITVAKDLLGRTLVRERPRGATLYAKICEVAAYEGNTEESMTEGASYAPGTLSISTKYGKRLLDIATDRTGKQSCITLIAGLVGDKRGVRELVQGPGKLTAALEIDKDLDGLLLRDSPLWIGGQAIEEEEILERRLANTPFNCKGYYYFR